MSKRDRYQFADDQSESASLVSQGDVFPGAPPPPPVPFRKPQGGAILKEGTLQVGAFTITGTGLQIAGTATQEDWTKVGELLFRLEGAIQWVIGDWLVYGEDVKWGDIPTIAEYLGRDVKTLYNYCAYSRGVKSSLRREDLSYTHHMLISGMDDEAQVVALAYAAENKLSVAAFRQWIKEQKGEVEPPSLSEQSQASFKQISGDLDKLFDIDPQNAKPQQHVKAAQAYQLAAERLEEFRRKWGL